MNRLAAESSPYLLQHADNPVDWQPWDADALRLARDQDKPILLSIGYSACHWCHVMAHESFEDEETARVMNELFVNIKVDREERPDLDRVYQAAHQFLAQRSGGWPLTVFLMPEDQAPFFAGTYFPREARFGMPAFKDVLKRIHDAYRNKRDDLKKQNTSLISMLERLNPVPASADIALDNTPIVQARRQLEADFDADNGGFGSSPKFPHPPNLEFLLRHADSGGDMPAMRMVNFTLQRMASSGLYDQLGGGFFRYCVDARWEIPHFEKMLYDNGPLIGLYADAWQVTGDPLYRRVVKETITWLEREMRSPDGGFYSTLDADSDGREGGFYVWTPDSVSQALLNEPQSELLNELIAEHYGLDARPNFDREWHLLIADDIPLLAERHESNEHDMRQLVDRARQALFVARDSRTHPHRDEKVLTSWNALVIRGLARASRALEYRHYAELAAQSIDFIHKNLWIDGRLKAVWKDEQARFDAYLDDHAFLIDAILESLETHWRSSHLEFAIQLADVLLERFQDHERGGFFFTPSDHENLIHRPKPFADEAMPSGNSVAARALWRLGQLVGDTQYLEAADRTLRAGWDALKRAPFAHCTLLDTLRDRLNDSATVVLRGESGLMHVWRQKLGTGPSRRNHVYSIPQDTPDLPAPLLARKPKGDCVAYVCRGFTCSSPMTSRDQLYRELTGEE